MGHEQLWTLKAHLDELAKQEADSEKLAGRRQPG